LASNPVDAAREFLAANGGLFRLDAEEAAGLELLGNTAIGDGRAVLLRQRFGSLPAGTDGLVALAVRDGQVLYVTSTLAGHTSAPSAPTLGATDAWLRAARGLGLDLGASALSDFGAEADWTTFRAAGLGGVQRVRLVAVPTYTQGVRPAYETIVLDELAPLGVTTFVDAVTGDLLVRHDRVAFEGEPAWKVFPANPSLDSSTTDTRERWCWFPAAGCDRVLSLSSPRGGTDGEWDRIQGRVPGAVIFFVPSNTTLGNNADTAEAWLSPLTPAEKYRPVVTSRNYTFPWQNRWFESSCDPAQLTPTGNDIDAAITNLFAMHNRMHNWSYHLGFTEATWNMQTHNFGQAPDARENDPEIGNAQAGALNLGPGEAVARDNANQITLNDGIPGITNMYLWQSLPNAAYVPCVDGDFDMAVIGHEYTHAISNRMVAGPDGGLEQTQSRSMGESWSDLAAAEYL
ncbi:MAG: M36 family metallopeptidase, partial [Actinomycetota bacterium]